MPQFFTDYSQQPQRTSLADLINTAGGIQRFQQQQQTLPLELRKLQAETQVAEETAKPKIEAAKAQAITAGAESNMKKLQEYQSFLNNSIRTSANLISKENVTYDDIKNHYESSLKNATDDPEVQKKALAQAMAGIPKEGTTKQYQGILARNMTQAMAVDSQIEKLFPSVQMLSTGAQTVPITTGGPLAVQRPGMVAGPGIEAEIPPTQQVVEPSSGATRLLGPISQRGAVPQMQTGVGPAQAGLQAGVADTIRGDWQQTASNAQQAPQRIAVFQNIKRFAPESFTGVGGARKELAAGVLNAIGISAYEAEKVATEELAKNSALLALAGGNTDAARALAEVANPNKKLNEKAIKAIADQMIGIENMAVAKERFLAPVTNDSTQYMNRKLQFNQVADPRLYQEMSAEDVAKLKASMSPAERDAMSKKIQLARQLGIL